MIVCGLYIVVWGKSQEMKMEEAEPEMEQSKNTERQRQQKPDQPIEVVVPNNVHVIIHKQTEHGVR